MPEYEVMKLGPWYNSEPFTIQEQLEAGNVVLIDFWTYSCINCVRTLPFLRDWHEKYHDRGLVILGVHRPEFAFERDPDNVAAAIERLDVPWPVALDNEDGTWDEFNNNFWPAKFLFDQTGKVVYTRRGEGDYAGAERAIRKALTEAGHDVSDIQAGTVSNLARNADERRQQTRELYGGYWRNRGVYAAQVEYYDEFDREVLYEDIDTATEDREHDQWYVHGLWRNEREAIVHARETENLEDYFAFLFRARSVNVVLQPPAGESYDVYISIDGRPLTREEAGGDVMFDEAGNSFIHVNEPRHYAIVELPEFGEHDLQLASNSDKFGIFALTFGTYLEGA
ncbi:MAG: redoxin domain-containing protein [Chloroflexi bacterium]|nr:redoxin domain-containing protein [Chloroflexota bacterium]